MSPSRYGFRLWIFLLGLACLLSLMDAGQTFLGSAWRGRPMALSRALMVTSRMWLILGFLAYPVVRLSFRFRLDGPRVRSNVFIHTVAAITFSLLHLASSAFVNMRPPRTLEMYSVRLSTLIGWLFALDFVTYWAILGAVYVFVYHRESKEAELEAAQLREGLTAARLQLLRAQLNPHFLFNALNAISGLALTGQNRAVANALALMSDLLRVSLDETLPQQIPLREELSFLHRYLDIQRIRLSDRLTVEEDIAADVFDATVPSLILQPLVENAIVHGIASKVQGGAVAIRASRRGDRLEISISDTGPGFAPGQPTRERIGLEGTRSRLIQLYGVDHDLIYGAGVGHGAVVSLSIPFSRRRNSGALASGSEVAS